MTHNYVHDDIVLDSEVETPVEPVTDSYLAEILSGLGAIALFAAVTILVMAL